MRARVTERCVSCACGAVGLAERGGLFGRARGSTVTIVDDLELLVFGRQGEGGLVRSARAAENQARALTDVSASAFATPVHHHVYVEPALTVPTCRS